jgi:uncharacterized protein YutE (UPF0331/DUF86 family)
MWILSYMRELSDALEDWEKYQSFSILEKPSTYRETFEILGRQKFIKRELTDEERI